jgi:prepilin-type processing-associated H-X9-DG protein
VDTIVYGEMVWWYVPPAADAWISEYPRPEADRRFTLHDHRNVRGITDAGYRHATGLNQLFCDGHVGFRAIRECRSESDLFRRRWFIDNQPHRELETVRYSVPTQ